MAPRARWENLDDAVRRALIDAAIEEFSELGFHEASQNQVLARAGLSKGQFYYYFDDKADLYLTVVREAMARASAELGGLYAGDLPDGDFWGWCEAEIARGMGWAASHPELLVLLKEFYAITAQGRSEQAEAMFVVWQEATTAMLRRGQELGAVRGDLPLELLGTVIFAMGEATDRWFAGQMERAGDPDRLSALLPKVMQMFRSVAAPRSAT